MQPPALLARRSAHAHAQLVVCSHGVQQSPARRLQSPVFASGGGFNHGGSDGGGLGKLKEGSYPLAPRADPPFESFFGLEPFDSDLKPPPMA
jgi:hypothetical protein